MSLLPDYTEIDRLRAEVARLTNELAETKNSMCYRTSLVGRLETELAKAELHRDTYRDAWQTVAAEIEELRAKKPAAFLGAGGVAYRTRMHWTDAPLYTRPVPSARAVPDGLIEYLQNMLAQCSFGWNQHIPEFKQQADEIRGWIAALTAVPQPPADQVPDAGKTIEKGAQ